METVITQCSVIFHPWRGCVEGAGGREREKGCEEEWGI